MTPESPSPSEAASSAPTGSAPAKSSRAPVLALSAALVLAAILAFLGLGNHPLWTDEANTALFARNYLAFGKFTAWDGRNVFAFNWGSELDENLEQAFMPTQPYYIAAAAFAALGESTAAARAPFALIGVLAIALTAWWTRRLFGPDFPWYLPALLLALQPAFLLFIRNARYYSPGVFWTAALLLAWSAIAAHAPSLPQAAGSGSSQTLKNTRIRPVARASVALLCVAGLFTSHTIYAVAALAILPVFFLHPSWRTRESAFLFALLSIAGALGLALVLERNPADLFAERRAGALLWLKQGGQLFWRHLRDMGSFEFFAWPMLLPLGLPWTLPHLAPFRPAAKTALLLLAAFLVYLAAVAAVSPQDPATAALADMRYALPVTLLGAIIAGVSLAILWRVAPPLGMAIAILLVFTNLLHIGPRKGQPRYLGGRALVRSTLLDYMHETVRPYRSPTAALIAYLDALPKGTKVVTSPLHLSFSAMFYVPDVIYCEQLYAEASIREDLKEKLPSHLFRLRSAPDAVLVIPVLGIPGPRSAADVVNIVPDPASPGPVSETIELFDYGRSKPPRRYRFGGMIETHVPDMTRPEIPLRLFHEPPEFFQQKGIAVYFPIPSP